LLIKYKNMKNVIKTFSLFAFFGVTFGLANAEYSVSHYDPQYTPYNLQAAIDHGSCDNEIEAFDQVYQEMRSKLREGFDLGAGATMASAARMQENWRNEIERTLINNDVDTEDALSVCLRGESKTEEDAREQREQERVDKREEEIRMGLGQCDLELIEDLDEEESEQYSEKLEPCVQARTAVIEAAVAACDFNFFENEMTRNERNSWFSERKYCEENPSTPQPEPVAEIVYEQPAPPLIPVDATPESVNTPVPATVEQTINDPFTPQTEEGGDESNENSDSTSEELNHTTTTDEVIEVTPDELERLVEQRMAEKQEEQPQPEAETEQSNEKPSFFRRAVDFFFGWL
jgi:hypothetical protein